MVATKLKQMLTDEGAVSPVIGVILMVAVTVVLAAVIGAFVFGIGNSLGQPAPNSQIAFDYTADAQTVNVTHDGGDSITTENTGYLKISGSDLALADVDSWGSKFDSTSGPSGDAFTAGVTSGSTVSAGDTIVDTSNVTSGETLELIWGSPSGDQSTTLGTFEAA